MTNPNRVNRGVPSGGEFDKKRTPEADVDLKANSRQRLDYEYGNNEVVRPDWSDTTVGDYRISTVPLQKGAWEKHGARYSTMVFGLSEPGEERDIEMALYATLDEAKAGHQRMVDSYAAAPDWGQVDVEIGSSTTWGRVTNVSNIAPGVARVDTFQHEHALKLSPERNGKIPGPLRQADGLYRDGMPGDPAEIVRWQHPEAFRRAEGRDSDIEQIRETARQNVVNWHPEGYEAATGESIQEGESVIKDKLSWDDRHGGDWIEFSRRQSVLGRVDITVKKGSQERLIRDVSQREHQAVIDSQAVGKYKGPFVADPGKYDLPD